MILEIDYGNTRLKWRLLNCTNMDCIARGAVINPEELLQAIGKHAQTPVRFCRVCSVRTAVDNNRLSELIKRWFEIEPVYAVATEQLAGVVNGYSNAAKLGVDRWLVIVAAYAFTNNACVVFDFGTALTVDYVNDEGVHLGGCIAPGQRMMRAALSADAQQLADIPVVFTSTQLVCGENTQSAISCGVSAMMRGFVKDQLFSAERLLGSGFDIFCTGGDGSVVNVASNIAVLDNDLVFKGLAIACPFIAGV
ncbi:MAG: type III pantothenate kinase [Pseudomonas sp.]|nr:type III pantothenate kinase [Pseudomonas sp.]